MLSGWYVRRISSTTSRAAAATQAAIHWRRKSNVRRRPVATPVHRGSPPSQAFPPGHPWALLKVAPGATPQGAAAQAKLCAKHGLEACFPGHAGADTVPLNGSVHGYYLKDEP